MLCWFAALHHHLERAEGYISEASAFSAARDLDTFYPFINASAAMVALHRGRWARALEYADDVLTRPGLTPSHRLLALVSAALIHARRGKQPVGELLDEALDRCRRRRSVSPGRRVGRPRRSGLVSRRRLHRSRRSRRPSLGGRRGSRSLGCRVTCSVRPRLSLVNHRHSPSSAAPSRPTLSRSAVTGKPRLPEWTRRGCPYDAAVAQLGGDIDAVQAALEHLPATRRPRCGPSRPAAPRPTARTRSRPPSQTAPAPTLTASPNANATSSIYSQRATATPKSPPPSISAAKPPTPTSARSWPNSVSTTAPKPPPTPGNGTLRHKPDTRFPEWRRSGTAVVR